MNKHLTFVVFIAAASIQSIAAAVPFAIYNHPSRSITIVNDTGAPLANASIVSTLGGLTNGSMMATLPGATKDDSEFPFAYTYLSFPVGWHNTGSTVQPGAVLSDIRFEYRTTSLTGPLIQGVFLYPEPSSCLMASLSALAFAGTARRARRRCAASSAGLSSQLSKKAER